MSVSFIRPDYKERAKAWRKRDEEEQHERILRSYFKPEYLEHHRKEAEREFSLLRPEYLEKLKQRDDEREEALHAKFDAALGKYLAGEAHSEEFSPEEEARFDEILAQAEGPSVAESLEVLAGALQREEGHIFEARRELERERRELGQERRAFEIEKAEASREQDIGEVNLDFRRGKDGKITSPVRLSGNVGEYDLEFVRGRNGRIESATIKPAVK